MQTTDRNAAPAPPPPGPGVHRLLLLGAIVFILVFARAVTRDADPDEHLFVAPAILTGLHHLLPYRDYPYYHMPGLVWLYAPLMHLSDNALLVTRTFSAVVGTISALMLYAASWGFLAGAPGRARPLFPLGIVALFLGARVFTYTNGWSWNHDASICALLAGVLLHLRGMRTGRLLPFLLAGVFLALGVSIRLTTAPALGAIALSGLFLPSALAGRRKILAAVAGAIGIGLVMWPVYLAYRASPDGFWFGNLGYPAAYKAYALAHGPHHLGVLGKIGHFFQTWCADPGNIAVLILLALALRRIVLDGLWRRREGMPIATLILLCVALWFGVAAPFQVQMQYHSVLLPFFLLLIAAAAGSMAPSATGPEFRLRWSRPMLWSCVIVLLVNFPRWYWPIVMLPRHAEWTTTRVMADSRWVREHAPGNALILTIDPIVALQAGRRIYPEFATGRFPLHVGSFMSEADRIRYRVAWGPQLEALVREHPPDAVLYCVRLEGLAESLARIARERGLTRMMSPDGEYVLWVPSNTTAAH